jgi:hypothetical protein
LGFQALNSVFSAVQRTAQGFRSSVYLITILYLVAGKLRLPHPRTKVLTRPSRAGIPSLGYKTGPKWLVLTVR